MRNLIVATIYYVSALGNDSWSGLSQMHTGGMNGPFATIARAVEAMRADAAGNATFVLDGTYRLSSPITLDAGNSNDTIAAHPGAHPVVSGGVAVTDWTVGADGIWRARVDLADVEQLVVRGKRQAEARYPNEVPTDPIKGGWLWAKDLPDGRDPNRELAYDKADFPGMPISPGMKVTVFSREGYSSDVLTVAKVDDYAGIITFDEEATYDLGVGSRYFVSGDNALLDRGGEWWFDRESRSLNFRPPVGFDGKEAVASGDLTLIDIEGAHNVTIRGLSFSDAATTIGTDDIETAAININSSAGVAIVGNKFANVAQGVRIAEGSHQNTVSANDFSSTWSIAINVRPHTRENTVTNNSISHSGEVFRTSGAIHMEETWGNTVSHNLIRNVPRFGIAEINWDGDAKSGGNLIEHNMILHSGQETPDVGGIYVYSHLDEKALGDTIRYNRIVDVGGLGTTASSFISGRYRSAGIYLDDFASDARVYGNFIQGTAFGGVYVHGGQSNEVFCNLIVDSAEFAIHVNPIDGRSMAGTRIHGNLIEIPANQGSSAIILDPDIVKPEQIFENVYFGADGVNPVIAEMDYSLWRSMGGDRGSSVVIEPEFKNAEPPCPGLPAEE